MFIKDEEVVFGQYEGYRDDLIVLNDLNILIFVIIIFCIDNERWEGIYRCYFFNVRIFFYW